MSRFFCKRYCSTIMFNSSVQHPLLLHNYLSQLLEMRSLRFFPILYIIYIYIKLIFFNSLIWRKIFPLLLNKFDPERVKGVKGTKWTKRDQVFLYKSLLSPASFPIKLVRLGVHQVVSRVEEIILPLVFIVGHG